METSFKKLSTCEKFVEKFKYGFELNKILVANNGIAALKFIRSMRQWCYHAYNNVKIIHFVAMVTAEDLYANAEYAQLADEVVTVPSGPSNLNYGNVDLIVELAEELSVEAVWAGWGHASENPKLPEMLNKHKILFLGPDSISMWLLGDKIAATIIAQSLNIPTLRWSGSDLKISIQDNELIRKIPSDIYKRACITCKDTLNGLILKIGFPILLKASEGGGGKGIRVIDEKTDPERVLMQISNEVVNSPIFGVKILNCCRHIEIQLIADYYGNVISLYSRDCSIQRRYQKIVEEAPAIICPEHVLKKMEIDAIKLAKSVGYFCVGTVEYLYNPENEEYYFLELNPRLQVEHPCTEIITDINLPACQLEICLGKTVKEVIEMQRNSKNIDCAYGELVHQRGHVISARITAESAEDGFCPSSGCLRKLNFRNSKNVWGYFSVHAEGTLHKYADSQFGHVFSWGENREEARKGMVLALKELSIHGEIRTTIDFLVCLFEQNMFIENRIHNEWLDKTKYDKTFFIKPSLKVIVTCGACCIGYEIIDKIYKKYEKALENGHIPNYSELVLPINVEFIYLSVKYSLSLIKSSEHSINISINESNFSALTYVLANNCFLITIDNNSYTCYMNEDECCYSLEIGSITCLLYKNLDLSILRSPSCGKIVSLLYEDGAHVLKGNDYAEIEVMKMMMPLTVGESGRIKYNKSVGSIVESGTIIATLELDDKTKMNSICVFSGNFDNVDNNGSNSSNSDVSTYCSINSHDSLNFNMNISRKDYKISHEKLTNILDGYCIPEPHFSKNLNNDIFNLSKYMAHPSFTFSTLKSSLNHIKDHLPQHVFLSISKLITSFSKNITSMIYELPINQIMSIIDDHANVIESKSDREFYYDKLNQFLTLLSCLRHGPKYYRLNIFMEFLQKYLSIESYFSHDTFEHCIGKLLRHNIVNHDQQKFTYNQLVRMIVSHANVSYKNKLIILIINVVTDYMKIFHEHDERLIKLMTSLSNLEGNKHLRVALRAKQFLIHSLRASFELRHNQLESIFLAIIGGKITKSIKLLHDVINSDGLIIDILPNFFFSSNPLIQTLSLEVYLRRSYYYNDFLRLEHVRRNDIPIMKFLFRAKLSQNVSPSSSFKNISLDKYYGYEFDSDDIFHQDNNNQSIKCGIFTRFRNFLEMSDNFCLILSLLSDLKVKKVSNIYYDSDYNKPVKQTPGVIIICLLIDNPKLSSQQSYADLCGQFVTNNLVAIRDANVTKITFILSNLNQEMPFIFHYSSKKNFKEDMLFRNVELSSKSLLELKRMANFHIDPIPCDNPSVFIYHGTGKDQNNSCLFNSRFFVRTIIRNYGLISTEASFEYMVKATEIRLLEALDQLDIVASNLHRSGYNNHILFAFTPCIEIEPELIIQCVKTTVVRHRIRLSKQKVSQAEMKMTVMIKSNPLPISLRLIISNDSGYSLRTDLYKEEFCDVSQKILFKSFYSDTPSSSSQHFHNMPVDMLYPAITEIQIKRLRASELGSVFVYDYPQLFIKALTIENSSSNFDNIQSELCENNNVAIFQEMIIDDTLSSQYILKPINRSEGLNDVGMVCWKATLYANDPGRSFDVIIVANDVTFTLGSITEKEACVFKAAGKYARKNLLPFIYLCCCSGARIGLAKEVMEVYKVKWKDEMNKEKGVDYIYVEEEEYKKLIKSNSISAQKIISPNGSDIHYKITDIYGCESGIGVENLRGSGLIAGEMSKCYDKIFTISLVSGRAVGIGAYLVRLGRRVIQIDKSCIILTGADALNELLGRKVYTSHQQLGGIDIMHNNGITQLVATDNLDGVLQLIKWLTYHKYNFDHDITNIYSSSFFHNDHVSSNYEPNLLLQDLFDKNSLFELNGAWAKTLIIGRARLGNIPVAYIINDIKTVHTIIPVDPADPTDVTRNQISIGQVLSPEASFKFSQSIEDANREHLPLFILANFKGFSAGMRDMYNQVLKFGAFIVDALRCYKYPIFVYILPYGELRGGSWAILDSSINPKYIEIYADPTSSANILEPSGAVSIKYRHKDLLETISRLNLSSTEHQQFSSSSVINQDDLLKIYQPVAYHFASLHDTPSRMMNKNVIKNIIPWSQSRHFFYYRLKYRLLQNRIINDINSLDSTINYHSSINIIHQWLNNLPSAHAIDINDHHQLISFYQSLLYGENRSFYKEQLNDISRKFLSKSIQKYISIHPYLNNDVLESLKDINI